jgi:predicted phosphodiesterase
MKIGILADIHERLDGLRAAIETFRQRRVDRIVLLGDVFDTGTSIHETIAMLREINVVGVWGNHELGLCHNPAAELIAQYGTGTVEFFGQLKAHFELEDILFCHGIPTWDATDPAIYYLGDTPRDPGSLLPVFATFPHRIFFIGHYHQWHLATAHGSLEWDGSRPITLNPSERYFVVVHAVLDGWCALFDTKTGELEPCFIGS